MIIPIPAIDIIGGRCVRLAQGDYSRKTDYGSSPVEVAKAYRRMGYRRLHLVDLDGARQGKPANLDVLRGITSATDLEVDFGGGVKTAADLEAVLEGGASAVSLGSMAVESFPAVSQWIEQYGAGRFIINADARDGKISTHGWLEATNLTVGDLIGKYWPLGVRRWLCTDISRDGMLCGPNVELYKGIMAAFPGCRLIASGGVGSAADIRALDEAGVPAVVIGRAFYEGRIDAAGLAREYGLQKTNGQNAG